MRPFGGLWFIAGIVQLSFELVGLLGFEAW